MKWIVAVPLFLAAFFSFGLWSASDQLLSPANRGVEKNLSVCKAETEAYWGVQCGNLRETREFVFNEIQIPLSKGLTLPGWLIKTAENGLGPARGAIMLVHAGGSDRREMTRYMSFYLRQGLDVLTFDLECHGEAPCPTYGLTYGERESKDVAAAYRYLAATHAGVYAFGTSVGADAVLMALPDMPGVKGVIAENPPYDFRRLIKEAPQSQSIPGFFTDLLITVALWRGQFDGNQSPATVLPHQQTNVPILFIHSRADEVVSYQHTQDLADLYAGPKLVWLPEHGGHTTIWDVNKVEYERKVSEFLGNKK